MDITVVVSVDPRKYRDEYGTNDTLGDIREDMEIRIVEAIKWDMRYYDFVTEVKVLHE